MEHIGLVLFGVGFWSFLAISAVAGIVSDYKKRQLEIEPLRAAIERGQQLDPAIIGRLMAREQRNSDPEPIYFRIGGIVTVAVGVGLGLLSVFVAQIAPRAFYPLLGSAIMAICVGVGLLFSATAIQRHLTAKVARGPGE
jgi:hypothetical protein